MNATIMNLLVLLGVMLAGWVIIIIIHAIYTHRNEGVDAEFTSQEMVKDGNNLFSTGVTYLIGNVICAYVPFTILRWVLFVALAIMALVPCISTLSLVVFGRVPFSQKLTAIINSFIPLYMAANIYMRFIRR